eukprot:scaffold1.g5249.t1
MDWQDDEEHAAFKGVVINHLPPPGHTSRQQKAKHDRLSQAEQRERELLLRAQQPLYDGEPEATRLARAEAAARCWDALSQRIKATLEGTDAQVFQQLLDFAQQHHRAQGGARPAAGAPGAGAAAAGAEPEDDAAYEQVPTGLVLAGGVNSANHARTFPNLVAHLRAQGCYAALLQPAGFGHSPQEALNALLCQLLGRATRADAWAALAAWYADQTGTDAHAAKQPPPPQQQEAGAAAAPPRGGPQLRERHGDASVASTISEAQLANRGRPVVVVVEGTEGVDVACLRAVIRTISLGRREVPITLLLGVTTNAEAVDDMLLSEITDRCMTTQHFKLATAMARLEALVREVLLGGGGAWPGLLFGHGVVRSLYDAFMSHYFSAGCIVDGLKHAAEAHFQSQPCSFLAAPALRGEKALAKALAGLPAAVAAEVKAVVGGRGAEQQAAAIAAAMEVWSRLVGLWARGSQCVWGTWAVGVHWLVAAAQAAGLAAPYREVLCDALAAGYMQLGGEGRRLLADLESRLQRLPAEAARQLAARLAELAGKVWRGAHAAARELGELQRLEEEMPASAQPDATDGDGQQEQVQQTEDQQWQEDGQAGPSEAAAEQSKRKRERYHSKGSRNAALLAKATAASTKRGGTAAAAAAQRAAAAATPGARLAAFLAPALQAMLATPPTKLPGAAIFSCTDSQALGRLTGAPREVLHSALTEPHLFLGGQANMGANAALADACLAFKLLDQDSGCANVADWFHAFREAREGQQQGAAGAGAAGRKRKAAVKNGKKKGKAGSAADAENADGGAGGGASGPLSPGSDAARWDRQVQALFTQATCELQFLGLIKPAKRRRGGTFVQRLVHMPADDV